MKSLFKGFVVLTLAYNSGYLIHKNMNMDLVIGIFLMLIASIIYWIWEA